MTPPPPPGPVFNAVLRKLEEVKGLGSDFQYLRDEIQLHLVL